MQQITNGITNYGNIRTAIRLRKDGPKEKITFGKWTTALKDNTIIKPKKNYSKEQFKGLRNVTY